MAAVDDLCEVLERFHLASNEFLKGNPEPVNELWSHKDDVTLANPFGPPVRGWDEVAKGSEGAALQVRDGEFVGYEIIEKNMTLSLPTFWR